MSRKQSQQHVTTSALCVFCMSAQFYCRDRCSFKRYFYSHWQVLHVLLHSSKQLQEYWMLLRMLPQLDINQASKCIHVTWQVKLCLAMLPHLDTNQASSCIHVRWQVKLCLAMLPAACTKQAIAFMEDNMSSSACPCFQHLDTNQTSNCNRIRWQVKLCLTML